jgi:protein tyrosine phosphatase
MERLRHQKSSRIPSEYENELILENKQDSLLSNTSVANNSTRSNLSMEGPQTQSEVNVVSVFRVVRLLREQRWSMVKKSCQYSFIYDYINFHLNAMLH